ncbi:MAG: hypothetical protein IJ680_07725 [Paludibacteraceae bacterium]|nr:transposase [Eubacterium sp.]MBR1631730.1 hypothetical protein [Paludibacteraceae bacterium]
MIKIIKGTYGHFDGTKVNPITKADGPQSFKPEIEERLVKKGVAVYVNEPLVEETEEQDDETAAKTEEGTLPEYSADMKLADLKKIANAYGVDAEKARTKAEVIKKIEAAKAQEDDVVEDDELPPDVKAAMPE